ncbi:MAG: hypothetical protein OEY49_10150, partial [Candidatus Heimdallarchaeota archaeon]|nr:hypothetical protein [Candidatus Heimdallarchaeota archaeon]
MSVSSSKYIRRFKSFALIALVFFGIAPILFAAIPNNESNNSFSIYNSDYDGLSNLRLNLESIQSNTGISKYNVTNIISNLNVLNRFNGSGALVIIAPTSNFAVTETISLVLYMLRGGSVIIIDDYGSGNQVLEPIFKAFENIDKFAEEAAAQGLEIPSTTDILSGGANNTETTPSNGTDGGIDSQLGFGAGAPSGFDQGDLMTNMIGDLIKRFAFNTSAVLMDAGSNSDNPARPVLIDFDQTEFAGYTFTQGIERIQMEFGTTISLQLSVTARDEFGNPILDETGNVTKKDVWMPLQKLTGDVIGDFAEGFEFELSLPFFPMYTSKLSWMETNFAMADDGNAVPDVGEWGNSKFATALSIPLIPGMGKLVMISDPSIFINRWTERYDENDNLQLFLNLIDMATSHIELTTGQPQIPVIF